MKISHTIHHSSGRHNNLSILLASSADRQSFSSAVINPYHCDIEKHRFLCIFPAPSLFNEFTTTAAFWSFPFVSAAMREQTSLRLFANSINILNPRSSQVPNRRWTVLCARLNPRGVARNRFTSTAHFSSPKGLLSEGKQDFKGSTNKSSGFRLLEGNRFWAGPRKTEEQRSRTGRAINIKIIGCMIIIMMIVCRIRIGFKCALLN